MKGYKIIKVLPMHIQAIWNIAKVWFDNCNWINCRGLLKIIQENHDICWAVVNKNNDVVAFRLVKDDGDDRAWDTLICVRKDLHAKGLGSWMFHKTNKVLAKKFDVLYSDCHSDNKESIAYQLSCGRRLLCQMPNYYGHWDNIDGLLFYYNLKDKK